VSRTVVREALSRLQAAGLVETRHGVGTFVSAPARVGLRADAAEIATVVDLLAMLELRIAVESEAAALAARRRTAPSSRRCRRRSSDFEAELGAGRDTVDADFRFHAAVADATGNRYYAGLMASFGPRRFRARSSRTPTWVPRSARVPRAREPRARGHLQRDPARRRRRRARGDANPYRQRPRASEGAAGVVREPEQEKEEA
jgi:DNA-binding FadR family transcriptional regulator